MSEGRFGRRLRRCVLVALFGAAFAIAGFSGAFAAVISGDTGFSTQDFTWGMAANKLDFTWGSAPSTLDFTWGVAPGTPGDGPSDTPVQLQRDFTWG